MTDSAISTEVLNRIAVVRVNVPGRANALDADLWQRLVDSIGRADRDSATQAIVLTGSEGRFIAGADLRELAKRDPEDTLVKVAQHKVNQVAATEKPLIAAIGGPALGGGCELALACDLRVAVPDAVLGLPETRLGIIPAGGGTQRLCSVVGLGRALEMVMTGRKVTAEEALAWGLVNQVVEAPGQEVQAAIELASTICRGGPHAVNLAKQLVLSAAGQLDAGFLAERVSQAYLFGTADREEGISAFLERRAPRFSDQEREGS